ncbi:RNA 2',3'-cyclic phosphodiesterase [Candidatus Cryosericum hinesii]|uniref:RNA 2',3'-cyclic phosphodiesterase n=1 Tax=Candidatus Cryosericum hinesii TaxID=2290915 RepID=A0A398DF60_9BACT|nr:RNA 2',3'-cyclic phosphodiesterase [Candidatus Cryosericum hinesii]RIE09771.1 RNA 2',3'-cyclic phosphodiesterase [Candidatus Cryosericum hinesii]RIE13725.1 RNA 2',3'-cyclic phosphodiesterase [Candidatus Cryosericum hinesii]RIE14194.1 RNA 2',3'-cyclic phosphodiesterase [Candidatus Cryosericum hinesii]
MRAFVAIPLPNSFSDWLRTNRTSFASTVPRLRLVPVASCHITLRFLGELPDEQIDDAVGRLSLAATPGTSVVLDRFGVFRRDGRPTVLWTGPSVIPQALTDLAAKIDLSLSGLGSNGRTEHFAPHVTLGRFAPGTRDDEVAAIEAGSVEPFVVPVTDVVLYESIMGQGHPVYIARASVRLVSFAE